MAKNLDHLSGKTQLFSSRTGDLQNTRVSRDLRGESCNARLQPAPYDALSAFHAHGELHALRAWGPTTRQAALSNIDAKSTAVREHAEPEARSWYVGQRVIKDYSKQTMAER